MKHRQNTKITAIKGNKFDIHAKKFILTYPVKNDIEKLEKSQVIEILKNKFNLLKGKVEYICVAFETGEEENYKHLHVALKCNRRVRIRNQEFLDIKGVHGHYKTVDNKRDSWSNVLIYIQKDENYEVWKDTTAITKLEEAPNLVVKLVEHLRSIKNPDKQRLAIKGLSTAADALYRLNKDRIDRAINIHVGDIGNNYQYCDFKNVPKEVTDWDKKHRKLKALLLLGKSETGKTSLAKSLMQNPLIVSIKEDLKYFDRSVHDGIIFDDFSLEGIKKEEIIHLFDLETTRTFDIKFSHARIHSSVDRIFTSNLKPEEFLGYKQMKDVPHELMRRIVFCWIENDMRKNRKNEE